MKLHNIAIAAVSALALGACSDYLDVEAPSQKLPEEAFKSEADANTALNGVYAQLLSGDTYGEKLLTIYTLNSDVDFAIQNGHYAATNGYRRFECDPDAGEIYKAWSQFYAAIEAANIFIDQMEKSDLITDLETHATYEQMLGEAKVIRAMNYHDLIWMFGDVPMSLVPSYKAPTMVYPVTDRAEILKALIADLEEIAPKMTSAAVLGDCDRISKEMAWAMIGRLSLTAAGYTLRPEGSSYGKMERMNPDSYIHYYETARNYCDSVISSGSFTIANQLYHEVFTNECNGVLANGQDVIFEIPFGTESTGSVGYIHGPKMDASDGTTPHNWGAASSSAQLNAFYRFSFAEGDMRRDYVNQLWYYTSGNVATIINDNTKGRTIYNGKWSKLWVNAGLGPKTTGSTGINYPYMRYTDVLLMYAEAVNECENGVAGKNGDKAIEALRQVRERAFRLSSVKDENGNEAADSPYAVNTGKYVDEAAQTQESFRKAVLDERKWEFAGENMRWRDLVRHNLLAENTFWNFWRYFAVAEDQGSTSMELEDVSRHDHGVDNFYDASVFPIQVYYKNDVKNGSSAAATYPEWRFPNQTVKVVEIHNAYKALSASEGALLKVSTANFFEWFDDNKGFPQDYFCYSLRGYMYCDYELTGRVYINRNGIYTAAPEPATLDVASLPVVRYILPYPRNVIARSNGQYVNQYGY